SRARGTWRAAARARRSRRDRSRRRCGPASPDEETGEEVADLGAVAGHRDAEGDEADDQADAAACDASVVTLAPYPQEDDRDSEQDERDHIVLDPPLETAGAQGLRLQHEHLWSGHDGSSSWRCQPESAATRH